MKHIRKIINDVLYVSRMTGTYNKKKIVFSAVVLSQITAIADIALIILFAALITGEFDQTNIFSPFTEIVMERRIILPIIIFFRFLFIYLQNISLKKLELNVRQNLNVFLLREVFDKRNYSVADAYFYLNNLSGHISYFYSNLTGFINNLLQIAAYSTYLFITDSRTVLTFALGAAVLAFPTKYLLKKSREFMHRSYEFAQQSNVEVQRIVDNMFLIKLLKKDEEEIQKYKHTFEEYNATTLNNHRYGAVNAILPSFTTMFVFSILLAIKTVAENITLDFIGVTLRLFQSLGSLTNSSNQIVNAHVHMEKFYEMEKNKIAVNKGNYINKDSENSNIIELKNVSFTYFNSEEKIFEDLNISIERNTHTILTGPNGSGKSTLLGLIAGVFYSQEGKVLTYNKKFGYIGATPLIFSGTLRENLMYGNDASVQDDAILKYLKDFDTFKEENNYNLEKIIDNKSLSSGQMQKIAFIRALLGDIDVLLLDESTANLDDKSRDLIFNILSDRQITIINSTHDPENFKGVDSHLKIEIKDEKRVLTLS